MNDLIELERIICQCAESDLLDSYNRIMLANTRYRRQVRQWKTIAAVGVSTAAVLGSVLMLVLVG